MTRTPKGAQNPAYRTCRHKEERIGRWRPSFSLSPPAPAKPSDRQTRQTSARPPPTAPEVPDTDSPHTLHTGHSRKGRHRRQNGSPQNAFTRGSDSTLRILSTRPFGSEAVLLFRLRATAEGSDTKKDKMNSVFRPQMVNFVSANFSETQDLQFHATSPRCIRPVYAPSATAESTRGASGHTHSSLPPPTRRHRTGVHRATTRRGEGESREPLRTVRPEKPSRTRRLRLLMQNEDSCLRAPCKATS